MKYLEKADFIKLVEALKNPSQAQYYYGDLNLAAANQLEMLRNSYLFNKLNQDVRDIASRIDALTRNDESESAKTLINLENLIEELEDVISEFRSDTGESPNA